MQPDLACYDPPEDAPRLEVHHVRPGDRVAQAAGGAVMTVLDAGAHTELVFCRWADRDGRQWQWSFPACALVAVPSEFPGVVAGSAPASHAAAPGDRPREGVPS